MSYIISSPFILLSTSADPFSLKQFFVLEQHEVLNYINNAVQLFLFILCVCLKNIHDRMFASSKNIIFKIIKNSTDVLFYGNFNLLNFFRQ